MNQKNQVIKTLEVMEKYFNKKSLTEKDLILLINDVYNSIIDGYRKKFIISTATFIVEECDDFADFIIDLSEMLIVSVLRMYSLDTTSCPYEVPKEKMQKLKKYLAKLLLSKKDNIVTNEMYSCLFTISYLQSIRNAIKNRKTVLSEKKKKKSK